MGETMSGRDTFDLTPQQYHAGLDKLWSALGLTGIQDEDVFTLAARAIDNEPLQVLRELFDIHHLEDVIYTIRSCEGKGWDGPLVKRWAAALERARELIAEKA
jgi:hypothetical protein